MQIRRLPQSGVGFVVTQTVREIDWESVVEHLINFGKNFGPGSAAVLERLGVLKTALHDFFVTFKRGFDDLDTSAENLRNDLPNEPNQENSNGGLRELHPIGPN